LFLVEQFGAVSWPLKLQAILLEAAYFQPDTFALNFNDLWFGCGLAYASGICQRASTGWGV